MKIKKVTVEAKLGCIINKCIDEAKVIARLLDTYCVEFDFNGKIISVGKYRDTQEVIDKYHEDLYL